MSTDGEPPTLSRRGLLRTATGGAVAASVSSTPAAAQEATIDMTDNLVFDPDDTQVEPGTTVTWENVGSIGHSVTAYEDEIPEEAEYFASGGFEEEAAARSGYPEGDIPGGESFQHTFEVEGEYGYFCVPHEGAGMVATITVGGDGGGDGGGGGAGLPTLPESAKTLGVAAAAAMATVVALAYFFLKYGGDYGEDGES